MFETSRPRRGVRRAKAAFVLTSAAMVMFTGVGGAQVDQVQASAQAASLQLLGESLVDTGVVSASNDGSGEVKTGDNTPGLELLGDQDLLAAGILAQDATATDDLPGNNPIDDRTAAACAGAIGPGGILQIGPDRDCTATIGSDPDGLVLDLLDLDLGGDDSGGGLLGGLLDDVIGDLLGGLLDANDLLDLGTISADAIYAECTASADGTTTGSSTLLSAQLAGLLGDDLLPENPAPNTDIDISIIGGIDLGDLLTLTLNEQTSTSDDQIGVTALRLTLLGDVGDDPLIDLRIGTVACGPFPPISAIPLAGLPIAAATFGVAALGGGAWLVARNRRNAAGPAAG